MYCQDFCKKLVSFVSAFALGFLAVNLNFSLRENFADKIQEKPFVKSIKSISETGSGFCIGKSSSDIQKHSLNPNLKQKPLQILSKPQPQYTDSARQNNIEGTVTLKVIFLKNGRIGEVSNIIGLPDGLTEQAISAAKKIKFQPLIRNGKPITVSKTVQYKFILY